MYIEQEANAIKWRLFNDLASVLLKKSGILGEDAKKRDVYEADFLSCTNLDKATFNDLHAIKQFCSINTRENYKERHFHNYMINTYPFEDSVEFLHSFYREFNRAKKFTDPFFDPLHQLESRYSLVRVSELKNQYDSKNCVIDIANGYQDYCSKQGEIGDCYLLQLIISIWYRYPEKIVSKFLFTEKLFETGAVAVKFWCEINNEWRLVIIDDYLPINTEAKFVGTSPTGISNNQYWPCLLEKAFAKLLGSYTKLDASRASTRCDGIRWDMPPLAYAMILGPVESKLVYFPDTSSDNYEAFEEFSKSHSNGDVLGLATRCGKEFDSSTGLAYYHAYGFIDMITNVEGSGFTLVKVQNPWSSGGEWNGDWSDNSDMWNKYPHIRKRVNFRCKDDGIFFIEKKDVYKCFSFMFKSKLKTGATHAFSDSTLGLKCKPVGHLGSISWSSSDRQIEFVNDETNTWYEKQAGYIRFRFDFVKLDKNNHVIIRDCERGVTLRVCDDYVMCGVSTIFVGKWINTHSSKLNSYFETMKHLKPKFQANMSKQSDLLINLCVKISLLYYERLINLPWY